LCAPEGEKLNHWWLWAVAACCSVGEPGNTQDIAQAIGGQVEGQGRGKGESFLIELTQGRGNGTTPGMRVARDLLPAPDKRVHTLLFAQGTREGRRAAPS
jgi:hypothetical protein